MSNIKNNLKALDNLKIESKQYVMNESIDFFAEVDDCSYPINESSLDYDSDTLLKYISRLNITPEYDSIRAYKGIGKTKVNAIFDITKPIDHIINIIKSPSFDDDEFTLRDFLESEVASIYNGIADTSYTRMTPTEFKVHITKYILGKKTGILDDVYPREIVLGYKKASYVNNVIHSMGINCDIYHKEISRSFKYYCNEKGLNYSRYISYVNNTHLTIRNIIQILRTTFETLIHEYHLVFDKMVKISYQVAKDNKADDEVADTSMDECVEVCRSLLSNYLILSESTSDSNIQTESFNKLTESLSLLNEFAEDNLNKLNADSNVVDDFVINMHNISTVDPNEQNVPKVYIYNKINEPIVRLNDLLTQVHSVIEVFSKELCNDESLTKTELIKKMIPKQYLTVEDETDIDKLLIDLRYTILGEKELVSPNIYIISDNTIELPNILRSLSTDIADISKIMSESLKGLDDNLKLNNIQKTKSILNSCVSNCSVIILMLKNIYDLFFALMQSNFKILKLFKK